MQRMIYFRMTFAALYLNPKVYSNSRIMNRKIRFCFSFVVLFLISLSVFSQSAYLPLNQEYNRTLQKVLFGFTPLSGLMPFRI